eukprot:GEMP01075802.1.p1 GENE.GEMP01075802.1~~GEMP01075802.1.p1  ORF type:complete len:255 (+),score=67.35 GEMP01075802.1:87-767(+)
MFLWILAWSICCTEAFARASPEEAQHALHIQATFGELNRTIIALNERVLFLAKQANITASGSLALQAEVTDNAKLKSEENIAALTILTTEEKKLEPEITEFHNSLRALNATLSTASANLEVASKLAKLEKRVDSMNGIFALMRPHLSKIKRRVDRMNTTLAGNFSEILLKVVDREIRAELGAKLRNTTEMVRLFDEAPANGTNSTTTNTTAVNATTVKKSFLHLRG